MKDSDSLSHSPGWCQYSYMMDGIFLWKTSQGLAIKLLTVANKNPNKQTVILVGVSKWIFMRETLTNAKGMTNENILSGDWQIISVTCYTV